MAQSNVRTGVMSPPGVYTVFASSNLLDWSPLGEATNGLGSLRFMDATAYLAPHKFYNARRSVAVL